MIAVGDRVPDAVLQRKGREGAEAVPLAPLLAGRKVVLFGLPGAFTPTCSAAHLPSFIRTRPHFAQKGVDAVICIAVNDIHVLHHWGETTGAFAAGIDMLADGDAALTRAMDLAFSRPEAGMHDRSKRYAMLVEDGTVRILNVEAAPGICEVSAGETLLAAL